MLSGLVLFFALASASASASASAGGERSLREVRAVEHWTVSADGYAVTFYPGFASRVAIDGVELYRQRGSYDVGSRGASSRHMVRISGGGLAQDATFTLDDPTHDIRRLQVRLPGDRVLTIDNVAVLCPPLCPGTAAAKGGRMLVPPPVDDSSYRMDGARWERNFRLGMDDPAMQIGRVDVELHGSDEPIVMDAKTCPPYCTTREPVVEHWTASIPGYEVTFHPGFASRVAIDGVDLYRQSGSYNVDADGPSRRHVVRISGEAVAEDVTFTIDDPAHDIRRLRVRLYGNRELVIDNTPVLCPPLCSGRSAAKGVRLLVPPPVDGAWYRMDGARWDRKFQLGIDDNALLVNRIELELHGSDETIVMDAKTCPPLCDPTIK